MKLKLCNGNFLLFINTNTTISTVIKKLLLLLLLQQLATTTTIITTTHTHTHIHTHTHCWKPHTSHDKIRASEKNTHAHIYTHSSLTYTLLALTTLDLFPFLSHFFPFPSVSLSVFLTSSFSDTSLCGSVRDLDQLLANNLVCASETKVR